MSQTILDRVPPPADARIPYGEGALQFADLRMPAGEGPHPGAIAIHGGFWRNRYSLDHLGHLCAALTERGLATWSIEYRRVGDEGGGWPGTFRDVTAASRYLFDHAAELGIDRERVVVLGHSAGGHLASWLASIANVPEESPIRAEPLGLRGAVPLAGVLDLQQCWEQGLGDRAVDALLGGSPADVPDRYAAASPLALVPAGVPQVVVHGRFDATVPPGMSEAYVQAGTEQGAEVSLLALPDAGHFEVIDPASSAWPAIADAVAALANG